MAKTNQFLTYYIVLSDPNLVKQYQAQFPLGYQFAPYNPHDSSTGQPGGAAVAFSAPWSGSTPPPNSNFSAYVAGGNYTYSPVWTALNDYDQSVASFTRHSGGFWGIGGDTVTYYWVGQFQLAVPAVPTVNTVPVPVAIAFPFTRWHEGFELGTVGPGGYGGASGLIISRDASRHVGGLGLAIRGATAAGPEMKTAMFLAGMTASRSWERMYLRLRQIDPAQAVDLWETYAVESSNAGVKVQLGPAGIGGGATFVVSKKQAGTYTIVGSGGSLPLWDPTKPGSGFHKIDILVAYADAATFSAYSGATTYNRNDIVTYLGVNYICQPANGTNTSFNHLPTDPAWWTIYPASSGGQLRIFVDGALSVTIAFPVVGGGLGNQGYHHRGSTIGNFAAAANDMYVDVDDWVSKNIPIDTMGNEALTSPDFLGGTKIALVRPTAYSVNHSGSWVGDFRMLLQQLIGIGQAGVSGGSNVAASASGSLMEVETDYALTVDSDPEATPLGVASLSVSIVSTAVGGPITGVLGWAFNAVPGGAAIIQTAGNGPNSTFFSTPGTKTTLDKLTPIRLRFTKSIDGAATTVSQLMAQAELVGQWGPEDFRATESGPLGAPSFPAWMGQHNAPFPRSQWAVDPRYAPQGPFLVVANTYVGTGTAQDLTFTAPIHFLYIRPTTGDAGGGKWCSSMLGGAHRAADRNAFPALVNVDQDPTFVPAAGDNTQQQRYRVRLVGTDTQFNAIGVTYQYIAISDPSARFMLNLAFAGRSATATINEILTNAGFTPEMAFVWPESYAGSTGGQPLIKGPQNAVGDISSFTAAAKIVGLTFGAGQLTMLSALLTLCASIGNLAMMLLRRQDGTTDPGLPGVMAIMTWTGDGTSSRTLSIAPASGKRPIFAICTGDASAGGFQRDPSHTTVNSTGPTGANSTTGITGAGIDSISVGAALNTNGVNYNMLVFFGDTTAGNGGFGVNGSYAPVQADYAQSGSGQPPDPSAFHPVVPPTPLVGEPDLDVTTILSDSGTSLGGLVGGQACEYYTRHVANMALSRIGVSNRITNIATDLTEEAVLLRSHVLEDTNVVLRDFDWPFATRYASLVLVAGTATVPVNQDWQYSYRLPSACMKARRLLNQNMVGRSFDRNPPKFRLGSDDIGPLVYTNEVAPPALPLVLEYTVRSICPALYGDALFRDALAWKFAFSVAPVLAKDQKKQEFCGSMYLRAIQAATVPAAQEQQQARPGQADWIDDRDYGGSSINRNPWDR